MYSHRGIRCIRNAFAVTVNSTRVASSVSSFISVAAERGCVQHLW